MIVDSLGEPFVNACALAVAKAAYVGRDLEAATGGPEALGGVGRGEPPTMGIPLPPGAMRNPRRRVAKTAIVVSSTGERSIVARPPPPQPRPPPPPAAAAASPRAPPLADAARPLPPPREATWAAYPGFFSVHMAVVTSCLGKRVSVVAGNSIESNVVRVLGPGGACLIPSLDDENNSVNMRVLDWGAVFARAREASAAQARQGQSPGGQGAPRRPVDEVARSENTISVTCRGATIVRFSWNPAVRWDDDVEGGVLDACHCLCTVMRGCC